MDTIKCPVCGQMNSANAEVCQNCKSRLYHPGGEAETQRDRELGVPILHLDVAELGRRGVMKLLLWVQSLFVKSANQCPPGARAGNSAMRPGHSHDRGLGASSFCGWPIPQTLVDRWPDNLLVAAHRGQRVRGSSRCRTGGPTQDVEAEARWNPSHRDASEGGPGGATGQAAALGRGSSLAKVLRLLT